MIAIEDRKKSATAATTININHNSITQKLPTTMDNDSFANIDSYIKDDHTIHLPPDELDIFCVNNFHGTGRRFLATKSV